MEHTTKQKQRDMCVEVKCLEQAMRLALDKRRLAWLQHSDDRTGGIMGLMPLVIGMPMRCSDVVDRKRKLVKHTRVKQVGWKLRPEDASVVAASTDAEYVLTGSPLCTLR